jgi:hypothetical protein
MNNRPRCVSPRCTIRNRHLDSCPDTEKCGGCLPRPALDGRILCEVCTRILGEDVLVAAIRHRQLGLVLTGASDPSAPKTSGGSYDANIKLNDAAAEMRYEIEKTLCDLTDLIVDQRGFTWPGRTVVTVEQRPAGFVGPMRAHIHAERTVRVPELARFCARSAPWLAGYSEAGVWAAWLRELANGRSRSVAFPSGVRRFILPGLAGGNLRCPEKVEDEPCPGEVQAIVRADGDRLPSRVTCTFDDEHNWTSAQWMKFGSRMLKAAGLHERAAA